MQKKNSKLESFLYRTLPEHKYERIRGYESCIVVSEKENKSFKYVILGDEWIYLSENPPKTIQQAVSLGDVVSVELVNDYPDFLMGDDKKNCQHLAITYWTTEPVKRRSFRRKKSPRSGSLSDLHGDRSNASTPLSMVSSQEVWSEDYGYSSFNSMNRPDSRGSINSAREVRKGSISKKKKKGVKTLHTIQSETEETILKSLKEELEEDVLEDIENQSIVNESFSYSKSLDLRTPQKPKSARSTKSAQTKKTPRSSRPLPESPLPKNKAFSSSVQGKSASTIVSDNNDLPKKNGHSENVIEHTDDVEEKTACCFNCSFGKSKVSPLCGSDKVIPPTSDRKRLFSASQVSNKPMSDVHIEITSVNTDMGNLNDPHVKQRHNSINSSVTSIRGGSRAGTPAQDDFERRSIASMASMSDFGGSMQRLSLLGAEGFGEKRQAVLNLYLLSAVTPMLMLIRSAWSTFLISSTLMLNPGTIETPKGSILRSSQPQREKIDLLFQQLKRDIFKAENNMDKLFEILNELKIGTEKNFALKKLFWKNSDLFHFFVKLVQNYLPKSPCTVDKETREDEFEFSSLVIEVLCMMFHESEIILERTQAMKAERGRSVVGLLMVLTCTPGVPEKISAADKEKMVTDFTKTSLGTIFELFLMAKQANWGNSEGNFYNISWMVSVLEELKHTEVFISRIIKMMLQLISPSCVDKLSPDEAVLLYQQAFIIDTFLQYSPRIKTYICAQYTEEFKYYVQPPVITRRLPQAYPVYAILIALIEEVVKKVVPPPKSSKR